MDLNWQTELDGLYVAGEAAGTFGVYRPGGSALNSTQVGSLRAAEHIARRKDQIRPQPTYAMPHIQRGTYNVPEIRTAFQTEMSRVADFDRSVMGMTKFLEKVNQLYENFFDTVSIEFDAQVVEVFKLYDMILTQRLELRMPLSNPLDRSPGDKQKANLPNGCLPMIS